MPFFTSLFSSSNSSSSSSTTHIKNSHLKRFINNVTKPTGYVPDIYDDLRDDGFYFRPSDTYTSTASLPLPILHNTAQASRSTPNLLRATQATTFAEIPELPTNHNIGVSSTVYRHTRQPTHSSTISLVSSSSNISTETAATSAEVHELATLPATTHVPAPPTAPTAPPRRSSLAAARQHALEKLSGGDVSLRYELSTGEDASAAKGKSHRQSFIQAYNPSQNQLRKLAHAPARPSPLKLTTMPRRPSEDVPIILSPRTAALAFEKALPFLPVNSLPVTPGSRSSVAIIKRKPVPYTPTGSAHDVTELPGELHTEVAELYNPENEVMQLPGLPSRLSRLETLRKRISVLDAEVFPGDVLPVSGPRADEDEDEDEGRADVDVDKMDVLTAGDRARRKRGGSAGSSSSADDDDEQVVEIGVARVVRGVFGRVGCARMKLEGLGDGESGSGSESESEDEDDGKVVGRVVRRDKRMSKAFGRERQRMVGEVGWWHTRGE